MDDSERNKKRDCEDAGVCKFTSVPHSRSFPWPFAYSVTEKGIVRNTFARRKAERKEIEQALL